MSESISISFKEEDIELKEWCNQNIKNISETAIKLLYDYQKETKNLEKQNKATNTFQMIMFLFLGITFMLLAIAPFIDILSILTTSLLILYSIILFIYTYIQYKNKKEEMI
jgi:uncharacterized membrane protein YjjP (DUF1212 family)